MGRRSNTDTEAPSAPETVTIVVRSGCSGKGWALDAGRHDVDPELAKMLIVRGHAEAIASQDGEGGE